MSAEGVKTPEIRKDSSHMLTEDHKDHVADTELNHSATRGRTAMSPGVESLKHIQFIEPAEGTPAALALAGTSEFV